MSERDTHLVLDALGETITTGDLTIVTPDSRLHQFGQPGTLPKGIMEVRDSVFFTNVMRRDPVLALGEGYMHKEWDTPDNDVASVVGVLLENDVQGRLMHSRNRWRIWIQHLFARMRHANTGRWEENIWRHYDYPAAFYEEFLSADMGYTCGYGKPGDTSEQYQAQKNERICRKLGLANVPEADRQVADLGCGFMSFSRHAAREHNAQVTGITLSQVQHAYATERNKHDGLDTRITPLYGDYRSLEGRFPFVVSIGMVEHVHNRGYGEFFEKVKSLMEEGGVALIHTIGSTDERSVPVNPFTDKYVFPGSRLARLDELVLSARESALQVLHLDNLGRHYAETLKHWREKFEAHIPQIQKINPAVFNDVFLRMWRFYLASSEAGFRHSALQLYQLLLSHDGEWPEHVGTDLNFGI